MKIYKAAIIGLGPSGLAVNKIIYGNTAHEIIAFENENINNRDNFFEPYMTKKTNGTGLGLAICKKIVEDHNGQIELLDSELLGGAMVRIKLFVKMK